METPPKFWDFGISGFGSHRVGAWRRSSLRIFFYAESSLWGGGDGLLGFKGFIDIRISDIRYPISGSALRIKAGAIILGEPGKIPIRTLIF